MEDQQLFGVPHGVLTGLEVEWRQAVDGTDQTVRLVLHWQSRRPSTLLAAIPDDQQISAYIGLAMDLIMNGGWMGKQRVTLRIRKVLDGWTNLGAEVTTGGSRIPSLH